MDQGRGTHRSEYANWNPQSRDTQASPGLPRLEAIAEVEPKLSSIEQLSISQRFQLV
jgi:hypothetical protein